MAAANKPSGQRTNTTSASGRKQRSESSSPHRGSRVEPSHVTEKVRNVRDKKAATRAAKMKG